MKREPECVLKSYYTTGVRVEVPLHHCSLTRILGFGIFYVHFIRQVNKAFSQRMPPKLHVQSVDLSLMEIPFLWIKFYIIYAATSQICGKWVTDAQTQWPMKSESKL